MMREGTSGESSSYLLVQRHIPNMVLANIEGFDLKVVQSISVVRSSKELDRKYNASKTGLGKRTGS
jgi:uncharacterized membrane protein